MVNEKLQVGDSFALQEEQSRLQQENREQKREVTVTLHAWYILLNSLHDSLCESPELKIYSVNCTAVREK